MQIEAADDWAGVGKTIYALAEDDFKRQWSLLDVEDKRRIPDPWYSHCFERFLVIHGMRKEANGHDVMPPAEDELEDDHGLETSLPKTLKSNVLNWADLGTHEPPKFEWLWDHWLSFHAHGIWGRGGVGKSLLAQQIATACAIGRPLWGTAKGAISTLSWHCEDDRDELWRRQDRICKKLNIGFDVLDNLHIDARCGLENALFTTEYGRPMWTPLYGELMQQVNDYKAQLLVLDNIAQVYGGNLNDQHHVTTFVNGILGLVKDRPLCILFLGHIAKSEGSEFAGAMAWENAIRLRMLFTSKLPDETDADPIDSGADSSETRFLCKRKANYTREDYVQFRFDNGMFVVQGSDPTAGDDTMAYLRAQRGKTVVLQAAGKLAAMGIFCQGDPGKNYLPAKIVEMRLSEGYSKQELRSAMNALIVDLQLVRGEVGMNSNRTPKFGLKVAQ